jgi:hypothetical protein
VNRESPLASLFSTNTVAPSLLEKRLRDESRVNVVAAGRNAQGFAVIAFRRTYNVGCRMAFGRGHQTQSD